MYKEAKSSCFDLQALDIFVAFLKQLQLLHFPLVAGTKGYATSGNGHATNLEHGDTIPVVNLGFGGVLSLVIPPELYVDRVLERSTGLTHLATVNMLELVSDCVIDFLMVLLEDLKL